MPDHQTTVELPKVYIYPAGKFGLDDYFMVALADTGDWALEHVCSDTSWGRHDLHDRKRKFYEERFGGFGDGEFYDLVQVDSADEIPLPTLVAAGIRNPDGSRPTPEQIAARRRDLADDTQESKQP